MGGFNIHEKYNNTKDDKIKNLTFGLFFDGTSNNRFNVEAKMAQMIWDNPKDEEHPSAEWLWGKQEKGFDKAETDDLLVKWNREGKVGETVHERANIQKKYTDHNTSSYENDHSNIDRLEPYYVKGGDIFRFYIEGEGTSSEEDSKVPGKINYGDDDQNGYAFGRSETGIRAKVKNACKKVADICGKKNEKINQITFDVYGFSRGAAAARNFVAEVIQNEGINLVLSDNEIDRQTYGNEGDQICKEIMVSAGDNVFISLQPTGKKVIRYGFLGYFLNEQHIKDISTINIQIRYVGIFDTVASYGSLSDFQFKTGTANWKPGVKKLNLNSIHCATWITHLTAADEHRINFALTRIPSGTEYHKELTLPGVHSDIGGSYINGANEDQVLDTGWIHNSLEKWRQFLIEGGWFNEYTNDSLKISMRRLHGKRYELSNKYSFISLLMMQRFSNESVEGLFKDTIKSRYKIPEPNYNAKNKFKNYLSNNFESLIQFFKTDYVEGYNSKPFSYAKYLEHFKQRKQELHYLVENDLRLYRNGPMLLKDVGALPETDELLACIKERLDAYAFQGKSPFTFKTTQEILDEFGLTDESKYTAEIVEAKLPELKEEIVMQNYLHMLRNRHLHLSSRYDGSVEPFKPTVSWIRDII